MRNFFGILWPGELIHIAIHCIQGEPVITGIINIIERKSKVTFPEIRPPIFTLEPIL